MRKTALFFFSLFAFFIGGAILARFSDLIPLFSKRDCASEPVFDTGFRPAAFPIDNHPFVVVIIGRNNGAVVEKTLESAFFQKYDNFRMIYIDDASDDGSFELARDLIYESGHLSRTILVNNEEKLGVIVNLLRAAQSCEDREILVVLNGEDRLAHEWVLHRINQYYANPDLWLALGQHLEYPSFQKGQSQLSHLKTFYAFLLKQIQESEPLQEDYITSLLEIAREHFQCIPDILYLAKEKM